MRLVHVFYQKKILIILSTLLGFVIGLAVVSFSKPVYEAKIKLTGTTDGAIAVLNQGRSWNDSFLKPLTARDVFYVFSNELASESVKKQFFKQFYLPSLAQKQKENYSEAQLYALFTQNFNIINYAKAPSDKFAKYVVAVRDTNAHQTALWLKQFLTLVQEHTINKLLSDMKQQNSVIVAQLQQQIDSVRKLAKAQRLDQIAKLREKVTLAQLARAKNNYWDDEDTIMNDSNDGLLYHSDEIQAEIKSLTARKSDDAFAPNLRELQAKVALYKLPVINPNNIAVFSLDGTIEPPDVPVAPKKRLIAMLCLVLGFLAGLFMVMFQVSWRKEVYGRS